MKVVRTAIIILVLLGVLVASGPRVVIDTTIHPPQLAQDLDAYLAAAEARFPDIKPGTEKTIIWADPVQKSKAPVAVVYIHGFSATWHESAPLSERIAAKLGGNLFYTRLAGHGRSDDALGEATVNAWLNDAVEAVAIGEQLGDQVVLIASSTSAALLTWLAANDHLGQRVSALVFLSPNFGLHDANSELLLWPWGKQIAQLVVGRYREWEPLNEQHGYYWTHRYPVSALLPMMASVKLARETDFSAVHQPLLILYTKEDIVVDQSKTEQFFPQIGSEPKQLVAVTTEHPWGHVLAGDILSPGTTEPLAQRIVDFLLPVLDAPEVGQ
ncbi:MAG: alpha/beta hydrolase [Caldilineaceae bacterium]